MVWRDSFPRDSFSFIENFRSYDFCPVYFVLPRLTAPGSPRMPGSGIQCFLIISFVTRFFQPSPNRKGEARDFSTLKILKNTAGGRES